MQPNRSNSSSIGEISDDEPTHILSQEVPMQNSNTPDSLKEDQRKNYTVSQILPVNESAVGANDTMEKHLQNLQEVKSPD